MKIFVTGGAGYIGSYTVKLLQAAGHEVIVIDNLSGGHRAALGETPLEVVDIRDRAILHRVFGKYAVDAVVHFAALIEVGESMVEPSQYFDVNVEGTRVLADVMVEHGVKHLIFSSTAAVYGNPETIPIPEEAVKRPTNVYGLTKLQAEEMLATFDAAYGLKTIVLRYFNVAGADPEGHLGDDHRNKTHLISLAILHALGRRSEIQIFGTDYPTPDGTGIRDYIHLHDLASAHLLALDHLTTTNRSDVFNLGTGQGVSVRDVLRTVEEVTGKELRILETARRAGDPAELVAKSDKAAKILGWQPRYPEVRDMVQTAWDWQRTHPDGYRDTDLVA